MSEPQSKEGNIFTFTPAQKYHLSLSCDSPPAIVPPLLRVSLDHLQSSGTTRSYEEQRWQLGKAVRVARHAFLIRHK